MIPQTLIDLGAAINVMTKDAMLKLNLQGSLRNTMTLLQLAYRSNVTLEGIVAEHRIEMNGWLVGHGIEIWSTKEEVWTRKDEQEGPKKA